MSDLISVIIPSYNCANYIGQALSSVLKQSYQNIELVICDDGSKDNSIDVICDFLSKKEVYNRFSSIIFKKRNENRGAHYTINEGICMASGECVAILNADDLYQENRFTEMYNQMLKSKSKMAFSSVLTIDANSNYCTSEEGLYFNNLQQDIGLEKSLSQDLIIKNLSISTGNLLFYKKLYTKLNGFNDYKYIHDWDFILRACLLTEPTFVSNTEYLYRLHTQNSFRELDDVAYTESCAVLNYFFTHVFYSKNKKISIFNMVKFINQHHYLKKMIWDGRKDTQ